MNRAAVTQMLKILNIHPDEIQDKQLSEAFRILLQLIEEFSEYTEKLEAEIQKLRDEINLLKGEQAKPNIGFGTILLNRPAQPPHNRVLQSHPAILQNALKYHWLSIAFALRHCKSSG